MVKWRPVTNNSPCFKIFPLTRLAVTSHGWPSNSRDPKPKPSTSGGRETRSSTSTQPSPTRTTRSVERSTSCSPWWTRPGAARWTAVSCWTTGPCLSRRPPSTSTTAVSNSRWSGTWTSTFTPMIIWPGSTRELSWTVLECWCLNDCPYPAGDVVIHRNQSEISSTTLLVARLSLYLSVSQFSILSPPLAR